MAASLGNRQLCDRNDSEAGVSNPKALKNHIQPSACWRVVRFWPPGANLQYRYPPPDSTVRKPTLEFAKPGFLGAGKNSCWLTMRTACKKRLITGAEWRQRGVICI